MDRLIYTAMTGAKSTMSQQASVANNLANVGTGGFRAKLDTFRAAPVISDGIPTRTFTADWTSGSDYSAGPIIETGRELDVAVSDRGWLTVQSGDGSEAYTRAGSFKLDQDGNLKTINGMQVLGEDGPINIPVGMQIMIGKDGTISAYPPDDPATVMEIGRLKLVNPEEKLLLRNDDGLFRLRTGEVAQPDAGVRLISGAIEGSNVNAVEGMVNMINLSRQYELNVRVIKTAEGNADKANSILAVS